MKKTIFIILSIGAIALIFAWLAAAPRVGDPVGPMNLTNIHGMNVAIPSPQSKWVHLQFRRFAGCPICNLHLQEFIQRHSEIEALGIHEVVVFHSPKESLLPYQGNFPFDVIGDPEKKLYSQFGVGSSIFSILDIRSWPAIIRGSLVKDRPKGSPDGGPFGLPADFLIASNGKVIAEHYGRHADDQWTVDDLLDFIKSKELIR